MNTVDNAIIDATRFKFDQSLNSGNLNMAKVYQRQAEQGFIDGANSSPNPENVMPVSMPKKKTNLQKFAGFFSRKNCCNE